MAFPKLSELRKQMTTPAAKKKAGAILQGSGKFQRMRKSFSKTKKTVRSQGQDYGGRGEAFEFLSGKHDAQLRKMAGTAFKRSPYYKRKTSRSPTRASSRSGGR
jgi:hypothetical protein